MQFHITTTRPERLGLSVILEKFANEQWVPAHLTPEEAAGFVMRQFEKTVADELRKLEIRCEK